MSDSSFYTQIILLATVAKSAAPHIHALSMEPVSGIRQAVQTLARRRKWHKFGLEHHNSGSLGGSTPHPRRHILAMLTLVIDSARLKDVSKSFLRRRREIWWLHRPRTIAWSQISVARVNRSPRRAGICPSISEASRLQQKDAPHAGWSCDV